MTKDRDAKDVIRARMARTGEAYAAARAQLQREGKQPAAQETPEAEASGHSIVLTKEAGVVFRAARGASASTWDLVLALRGTAGVAGHVLAGLIQGGVATAPTVASGQGEVVAGKAWLLVVVAAKELATAEGQKLVDTGRLLRAAVAAADDVPAKDQALAVRLKGADLAALCAQAEQEHGTEQSTTNADGSEKTGMFERFTDKARMVVVSAQEEARALDHNWIGTEHLLLGLLKVQDGVAAKVLASLGVSLEQARGEVEAIIGRGDEPPSGHIPFTPRAKSTLEQSLRAAVEMSHNYIGTEHLLLGLLAVGECVATHVLLQHEGVTLESVRAKVLEVLAENGEP